MTISQFFEKKGPIPFTKIVKLINCSDNFENNVDFDIDNIQNLVNAHKRETKKRRKEMNARDREIRAGERKVVHGKGNNGKTDQVVKQQTGKQYGQRCVSQSI